MPYLAPELFVQPIASENIQYHEPSSKIATNIKSQIKDWRKFLPTNDSKQAPEINNQNEASDEKQIEPKTTKEANKSLTQKIKNLFVRNSKNIRKDLEDCKKVGGNYLEVDLANQEANYNCKNNKGELITNRIQDEPSAPMEKLVNDTLFQNKQLKIKLGKSKGGKSIILYSKKEILYKNDSFVLTKDISNQDFFQQVQTEVTKNAEGIREDTTQFLSEYPNSNLEIESNYGIATVSVVSEDGNKNEIGLNDLSDGTKALVGNLRIASQLGSSSITSFSSDNKFNFQIIPTTN